MAEPMRLTLFDLDNTLLAGDSDYAWGEFIVRHGLVDAVSYAAKNAQFFKAYQQGTLDQVAYLEFCLEPLTRRSIDELGAWHQQFMIETIEPMMANAGRLLVAERIAAGDVVAIITSTNSFVTGPIAKAYGIDHLIASNAEIIDGRYTGRLSGVPAFREGKIVRLRSWLQERGQRLTDFSASWFYSDSINDLPLLETVTDPVVVDPDGRLSVIAEERGWPVISLRERGHAGNGH